MLEVFMSDYLLDLNEQQYQAVTTKSQYVRVDHFAGGCGLRCSL